MKNKPVKRVKTGKAKGQKELDVQAALSHLAHAIAHMKDKQCGNEGYNWLLWFYNECSVYQIKAPRGKRTK